jgi:dTDP-D-glucose 4,6-dehydratase
MWTARSRAPAAYGSTSSPDCVTIASNVSGTFHLLQAVRAHWKQLPTERQAGFRFHHISTDEVFGSLGETGRFSETTRYDPRSPYSASKAASDHMVYAWRYRLRVSLWLMLPRKDPGNPLIL